MTATIAELDGLGGVISANIIARYIHLGTAIEHLTEERVHLRDVMLLALDNGFAVAADSPWAVYKVVQDRANVPWREVAIEYIRKAVGDRWASVVTRLEARHRLKVTMLNKRPNPAWAGGEVPPSPAPPTGDDKLA